MTSMGFTRAHVIHAITALSAPSHTHIRAPSLHIDRIIEWMEEHEEEEEEEEDRITHIMSVTGCTQHEATHALQHHEHDVSSTILYLLEQVEPKMIDTEHRYLHYGDCIVLRCMISQRYLGVRVATEEEDTDTATSTHGMQTPTTKHVTPTPSNYLKATHTPYDKDDTCHEKRKLSYAQERNTPISIRAHTPAETTTVKVEEEGVEGHVDPPLIMSSPTPIDTPVLPTDGRVYATCATITDECWFILRHPSNSDDTSVIRGGYKVALETNTGCYVGRCDG